MKSRMFVIGLGFSLLLSNIAMAAPNCAQVLKNLGTGRTPDEVADTMGISLEEVQGCQAQADQKKAAEEKAGKEKKEGMQEGK